MPKPYFSCAALIASAALSLVCAPARAGEDRIPALKVHYDELNLHSDAGVATLYARLTAAANNVCAAENGRSLQEQSAFRSCVTASLERAVRDVRNDAVLALHTGKANGWRRG